jgi:thiamine monophosphate kinase
VLRDDPTLALTGGEDYEVLFCMRPGASEAALSSRLDVPVRRIGRIVRGNRATLLDREHRRARPLLAGWDQLRART